MKRTAGFIWLAFLLWPLSLKAGGTTLFGGLSAKGYLNMRYAYIGSRSPATVYSGLRLTGSFELAALSGKISFKYRSHHWIQFQRPANSLLESPFENRHIFQTLSLEFRDLVARGLKIRVGRMFEELDYASLSLIEGGRVSWEGGGFALSASAGRAVDYWRGQSEKGKLQASLGIGYRSEKLRFSLGIQKKESSQWKALEVPAGLFLQVSPRLWLDANGSYDLESRKLARAGLGLSWMTDSLNLSLTASQWQNPFDQFTLVDKNSNLTYWGQASTQVPLIFRDIRLSLSLGGQGFGFRGSAGLMQGARSGWLASSYMLFPPLAGFRLSVGGQAMKSDFIDFTSLDLCLHKQVGDFSFQVQSQSRLYQWQPRPSDFRNMDNYSELAVDYPLFKHFWLSLAAGGYFRRLGDESFKPQLEIRLIARL